MPFQPLGYKKGKQTNEKQQQIKNKITTKHCTVVSSGTYPVDQGNWLTDQL